MYNRCWSGWRHGNPGSNTNERQGRAEQRPVLKAHPTLIGGFLREYCEVAAKTIFEQSGVLDKFVGDGVMALFGVLNGGEDEGRMDAIAAVRAALDLRPRFDAVVGRWMEQWKLYTPHKIETGLGCGIHTGEALVGNVGTDFRDQFTALGPHVNFAARIAARAKPGEILVSQSTETRVRSAVTLSQAGEITDIKNIPGTYSLFAASDMMSGQRLLPDDRTSAAR